MAFKRKTETETPAEPIVAESESHDSSSAPTCMKCGRKYLSLAEYERDDRC